MKVEKITIDLGTTQLELTPEEARELCTILSSHFYGGNSGDYAMIPLVPGSKYEMTIRGNS